MDKFRKAQHKHVCVGGIHCHCCNQYHGKNKRKLNRQARATLKSQDKKENREDENTKR